MGLHVDTPSDESENQTRLRKVRNATSMTTLAAYRRGATKGFQVMGSRHVGARWPFLARTAKRHGGPDRLVLDLGSGLGWDALYFSETGAHVIGVEPVSRYLRIARGLRPIRGKIRFVRGQFEDVLKKNGYFKSTRAFDLIWANASLIHVRKAQLAKLVRALGRHLAPEGVFAATFLYGRGEFVEENSSLPGRFFALYTLSELRAILRAAGFSIVSIRKTTSSLRKGEWIEVTGRLQKTKKSLR